MPGPWSQPPIIALTGERNQSSGGSHLPSHQRVRSLLSNTSIAFRKSGTCCPGWGQRTSQHDIPWSMACEKLRYASWKSFDSTDLGSICQLQTFKYSFKVPTIFNKYNSWWFVLTCQCSQCLLRECAEYLRFSSSSFLQGFPEEKVALVIKVNLVTSKKY